MMKRYLIFAICLSLVLSFAAPFFNAPIRQAEAAGTVVGIYDAAAAGIPSFYADASAGVGIAGGTPVGVETPDAATLATLDVLVVFANFGISAEWGTYLPDVTTAVQNGLILIMHDRQVFGMETLIPGGSGLSLTSENENDLQILSNTLISNGPAGSLDNTSLDDGDSSAHGYVTTSSVPAGGIVHVAFQSDATRAVTIEYQLGNGHVIYSTVPLDCYVDTSGCPSQYGVALRGVYYPNIIAYALSIVPGPRVIPNIGAFLLNTNNPKPVYESPNGNSAKLNGMDLWLPADADSNGFDTYMVTQTQVVDGVLWLAFFIGGDADVWIRASEVVAINLPE